MSVQEHYPKATREFVDLCEGQVDKAYRKAGEPGEMNEDQHTVQILALGVDLKSLDADDTYRR
jgi:hypothetical protein